MSRKIGRVIGNRKFCPRCHVFKLLDSEFGPNSRTKDGYQTWCRTCRSKTNPKRKYNGYMDRFWKQFHARTVSIGGCLEWMGRYTNGYPCVTFRGKLNTMLRRVIYRLTVGDLSDDEIVIATCDNNRCVKQGHLKKISREEQFARLHNAVSDACTGDLNPAHRHPENLVRGSQVHTSKLTEDDVRDIRRLYRNGGMTYRKLADMYGIRRPSYIGEIVRFQAWKHVG